MGSSQPPHRNTTWAIVESRGQPFAIEIGCVREFIVMPEVVAVPGCVAHLRGVIHLRGQVLPLLDLRKSLGWQSLPEEIDAFTAMMDQREQDHRRWLDALEQALRERTEFKLATDPHQCAFGRWYYSYRTDSPWIASLLKKFEIPHNRIHACAKEALALAAAGRCEEASQLIDEKRRCELREMVDLFQSLKNLVRESRWEIAMIVRDSRQTFAVAIEAALAVESTGSRAIHEIDGHSVGIPNRSVQRVLERSGSKSLAMVLDHADLRV